MADASATKEDYIKACAEIDIKPEAEVLAILNLVIDDSYLEPGEEFCLRLHANKRDNENQFYRRKQNDQDVAALCKTLRPNTFVVGLDLGYNSITDEGAKILGQLLQETMVLRELVLSYNDITESGGEAIARGVQVNETLQKLKLNGNKIGNKGCMAIAGALQVNTVLEDLDLAETDMKTESVIAIATVLNNNVIVKSLNVNRPILLISHSEETTVHMARMLRVNSRLRELHLSKHDIRDFGATRLMENLIENSCLTHLDLSCNRITRDGAKQLAVLLKANTPLEFLNLAYNRIEDDGAVYLSEALSAYNSTLQTLVVCSNQIADTGMCALARALKVNSSLRQIYIWGNKIGEPTCNAFQELVGGPVPRIEADNTDVQPYVVDGRVYLAQVYSPY